LELTTIDEGIFPILISAEFSGDAFCLFIKEYPTELFLESADKLFVMEVNKTVVDVDVNTKTPIASRDSEFLILLIGIIPRENHLMRILKQIFTSGGRAMQGTSNILGSSL